MALKKISEKKKKKRLDHIQAENADQEAGWVVVNGCALRVSSGDDFDQPLFYSLRRAIDYDIRRNKKK